MTDFDFALTDEMTAADREVVHGLLRTFNRQSNPEWWDRMDEAGEAAPLTVVLRESGVGVIGGLCAKTVLSWLKIDIMVVDPAFRGRGMGTSMLELAEREAFSRGCRYSFVETMEFQAPGFYRRHGYDEVASIPDWDSHGHSKFFFTKRLVD